MLQYNMGVRFAEGRKDMDQGLVKAVEWWHKAAEARLPQAMCQLGTAHRRGLGVPQSNAEAARWYQKAADKGHPDGMYQLGRMLIQGKGAKQDAQDYAQAQELFERAAEKGLAEAQFSLGLFYEYGKGGVVVDLKRAEGFYAAAAKQGNVQAAKRLDALRTVPRGF